MSDKKFLGWSSLGLFVLAVLILLLLVVLALFFPNALPFARANTQALILVSGVLALIAALLGLISRGTPQGKVGGIGGLVLFLAVAVLLSFTLVTRVETQAGAPQMQPVLEFIESGN